MRFEEVYAGRQGKRLTQQGAGELLGVVLIIHWGTFSGVMAATVTGLLTSLGTSGAKRLIGCPY